MSSDLIEIHVVFERTKSDEHMQRIANKIVEQIQVNIGEHFARQRPRVYIADIRGPDDEED